MSKKKRKYPKILAYKYLQMLFIKWGFTMQYKKTVEHRKKISESLIGKSRPQLVKLKISSATSHGRHYRSLLWTVQDPRGHIYITKDIKGLCDKFKIPYSTLRLRHQQKDTSPIWQGRAKGWAVLKTEEAPKFVCEPFEIIDSV